jgi:hypothetical protein
MGGGKVPGGDGERTKSCSYEFWRGPMRVPELEEAFERLAPLRSALTIGDELQDNSAVQSTYEDHQNCYLIRAGTLFKLTGRVKGELVEQGFVK